MCGIVGVWSLETRDIYDAEMDAFTDSLAHRGPDGRGVYRDKEARLCLGHRRLAIIDLSDAGKQPMSYLDGRYTITFNGEIYNYPELRKRLEGLGHRFKSSSDTEVVLAAYAQWGEACQTHFNGMWALAIWDNREKKLFLSRDRFGVKPLHYYYDGTRFAFASEMKAFLALDWFDPVYAPQIVARALYDYNSIEGSEDCLLTGLKRLMGGYCLTIMKGHPPKVVRWWNTLEHLHAPPSTKARQIEKFRELFFDACGIRTRSDVPIGAALSGGLDSGSIFCALWKNGAGHNPGIAARPKAFVASFPGTPQDERQYAEAIIRHTGALAVFKEIDPLEGINLLDKILFDFEEIYDLPASAWLLYRRMREDSLCVSIDGHGGDELLAGYHHHVEELMNSHILPQSGPAQYEKLRTILIGMYPPGVRNDFPSYFEFHANSSHPATVVVGNNVRRVVIFGSGQGCVAALNLIAERKWEVVCIVDNDKSKWGATLGGHEIKDPAILLDRDFDLVIVASAPGRKEIFNKLHEAGFVYGKDFIYYRDTIYSDSSEIKLTKDYFELPVYPNPWLIQKPEPGAREISDDEMEIFRDMGTLNRRLYSDFHFTRLPTILRNFDRVSMAHGVEIRAPFMDWRLACYALSLPPDRKLGDGFSKLILREAMRGTLPEFVRMRSSKIGFANPMAQWLGGPLKTFALDTVNSSGFLESQVWNGPAISQALEAGYKNGDLSQAVQFWPYLQTYVLTKAFLGKRPARL
jgi:asparagine synthase (glutamine-hydrolysing)